MQGLPQTLNGKSTDKALFCLYEDIYLICYFIWGFFLNFSLVLLFTFTLYLHFVI